LSASSEALPARKKQEDTADGCRALAQADRARAAETSNGHMRDTLQRSAAAWDERARLLDRLEATFNARAQANLSDAEPQQRGPRRAGKVSIDAN